MRVCLFEDEYCDLLEPLTLTRPACDLRCGATTLAEKQQYVCAAQSVGLLVRSGMTEVAQLLHPGVPVNDYPWLRAGRTMLVNSRWLPAAAPLDDLDTPCVGLIRDEVAYAVVDAERLTYCSSNTWEDCLATWKETLPQRPAPGQLLRYPWQLVDANAQQLTVDCARLYPPQTSALPPQVHVVGPRELLWVAPSAKLDPLVVIDTTGGPVVIEQGAVVSAFTRIEGPAFIGPKTQVFGAKIRAGTTLGPNCRIGGEIEAAIIHGHTNKYHEGFLGHAYLGEWVNLGAGTHNSDLRNDYGEVTVVINEMPVRTGLSKVGCFIGDHTKTGLGTLINTGSNIGIFCNVLPAGRFAPKFIPSFTNWLHGGLHEVKETTAPFLTAARMMSRRQANLTAAHVTLYRSIFDHSTALRRRSVLEDDVRNLRRSA